MAGLADAIASHIAKPAISECPVCVLLTKLPKDQAADLRDALAASPKVIPSTAIRAGLEDLGHVVPEKRMLAHRNGRCGPGR